MTIMNALVQRPVPVLRAGAIAACAIFAVTTLQAQSLAQPLPSRITGIVDDSSRVTLQGNTHPFAQSRYDRGPAPISMPADRLLLVLKRSMQQEADLQTYLQSVQDANSPDYHKFVSPDEFGKRFGVGDNDLQTIQAWLSGNGLTIDKVSRGRMAIELSGTVGQVQSAFHTSIHSYVIGGKQYWANATDPQIPEALIPVVAGLASLSSFKPRAQFIRGPSGVYDSKTHTITPTYTTGSATSGYYIFLGPADAATIYDTPNAMNANVTGTTYDGSGVTIGIAGDSNIDLTQNANYRATFGLAAKATTVVVDGADPGENGDAIEAYLDTQVAGGIAPNANVILYTAAGTSYQSGLFLAIARALDDNQADILNVSFGACEASFGKAGNQYVSDLWEQAAAQGISVTVSSGDSGSAGCDDPNTENDASQGLAVNAIGSTPFNIAVGGTDYDALYGANFPTSFTNYVDVTNTLPNHRSALKYIPEEPWNDSTIPNTSISLNKSLSAQPSGTENIIAGGGGISGVYPLPAWQSGFGVTAGRNIPDVSFLAGNGFYGAVWGICTDLNTDASGNPVADCVAGATGNNFNLTGVGGTSAAAPAFAGMLALAEQKAGSRLGQADYVLYNLAKSKYTAVFHDVTTGDNSVSCAPFTLNCTLNSVGYNFLTGYNAVTGYDAASGLGSVDATQMLNNWASAGLSATTSSLKLNGATTAINITHGQSVAVSASVTSGGGTPAGDVALVDNLSAAALPNNESIGDFSLASGVASGTTTSLPGGTYQVSAHYAGSSSFVDSDSNAIPVTVGAESSTTSLKVTAYDPSSGNVSATPYYGFIYVMDAQPYGNSASAGSPNGVATGTITFKNGSTTLGSAALDSSGTAEEQTTVIPGGGNSLTAIFPGDASFLASTSAPFALTVVPALTTFGTPSLQPGPLVPAGTSVTIAVTISTDSVGTAPTGNVTFENGSTVLGTVQLAGIASTSTGRAGGTASFSTTSLPVGTDSVVALYSGDGNYAASTSGIAWVTVQKASTSIAVTPSSMSIHANQPLQVTVTPAPASGLPLPTGTVTAGISGALQPAVNLVNGTATVTIPANSLPLGNDAVIGNYSGDADYAANSGNTSVTVISSGTLNPTVTVVPPTATVGAPFSITVTVSGPMGDAVPTGSVSLSDANLTLSQNPVQISNGSAVFTVQSYAAGGPSTVTATYLGDSNYTGGSGTGIVNLFAGTSIQFSPSAPTIPTNQALTTTVTVSGNPNFGTPTGTVTLSGGFASPATQLVAGVASFTIPANTFAVGSETLTASYSGDANYSPSTSSETVSVSAAVTPGLTLSGAAVSLPPGAITANTSTITLTPMGGFTGSVVLTAAITSSPVGAQDLPTFTFGTTSPVSISSSAAATATLTISTTAATSAALHRPARPGAGWLGGGGVLACILLFGVSARRRSWQTMLGLFVFLIVFTGGILSCGGAGSGGGGGGGSGNPGTTAGTYTVTVTGTSGTTTATGTVTLTVQ